MSNYVYRTVTGDRLRAGDELRAADGESWLDPIKEALAGATSVMIVSVWIHNPRRGQPDFELHCLNPYRVRRRTS